MNVYLILESNCGEKDIIDLSTTHAYNLTSPGYPNGYAPQLNCQWIFTTSVENHLQIKFRDVALDNTRLSNWCLSDYVAIYNGKDGTQSWEFLKRVCLPNATDIFDLTTSNYMKVEFRTDSYLNESGFSARVFEGI